jgi:hypothetical protein
MIGIETVGEGRSLVPVVEFQYPDEGDMPAPVVRDQWREAPMMDKCVRQRFAAVPSGDVMTMSLLDKRLEVLRYALVEAVAKMDIDAIHRLVTKAKATVERIATEQLPAADRCCLRRFWLISSPRRVKAIGSASITMLIGVQILNQVNSISLREVRFDSCGFRN